MDTILVPLDWSELSAQALPYATHLGKILSADVRLLHVVTVGEQDAMNAREYLATTDQSTGMRRLESYAAVYLEEQAAPLRQQGLVVRTGVIAGSPDEEIVKAADACEAALIVMATHGRGSVGRWLVGSVAHKVIRLTKRPLLAIRGEPQAPLELRRILVPLDGSSSAREALPMALHLAKRGGGSLVLLTVLPPRYGLDPAVMPPPTEEELGELRARLIAELNDLIPDPPDVPVSTAIAEGFVGRAICREAEAQRADLIVMTTHGYSGPRGFELGSVTDKVLHGTRVPTLVVPNWAPEG